MERQGNGWFGQEVGKEAGKPMERFALDVEVLLHKGPFLPSIAGS
jgi:hypothetical protein